jgi:hypothetical protein
MTAGLGLKLTGELAEKARALLKGKRLTAHRLDGLLDELTERRQTMPHDISDIEQNRVPHRSAGVDPQAAQARLQERIEANRAAGLDPLAPPVDDTLQPPETPVEGDEDRTPQHQAPPIDPPEIAAAPAADLDEIERRKQAGVTRFRQAMESTERKVIQQAPGLLARGRSLATLEEAAAILFAELQPGVQDAFRQFCLEQSLDSWVVFLGAIQRVADLQEFTALDFEPHHLNRVGTVSPSMAAPGTCERCGVAIPQNPERRGQRFCCSRHGSEQNEHSEGCAGAHMVQVRGRWVDTSKISV